MTPLFSFFLIASIFLYVASLLLFLGAMVFASDRSSSRGFKACVSAFAVHTIVIAVRWIASGHPPVVGRFEHALAGSWFIVAIFVLLAWRLPAFKDIGVLISTLTLALFGYGVMANESAVTPLPPPFQSYWLWIHVTFAWITYGAYHVSAGIAVLYLLKERKKGGSNSWLSGLLGRVPELLKMDDLIFKLIVYGFIAHVCMLGSGALWAYGLWGRYWGWDPIETWSLISWLVYGLCIHLRVAYNWRGRKMALLALLALAGIIITFGGIGFIKGLHTTLL